MTNIESVAIWVRPDADNVAVGKQFIPAGTEVAVNGRCLRLRGDVQAGWRFAVRAIAKGKWAVQYGHPFGVSAGIAAGDAITPRNLRSRVPRQTAAVRVGKFSDLSPLRQTPAPTFMGFKRGDGRVGTRNWVLIVPTSMCSAHECQTIATTAEMTGLWSREKFPNVDGVTAIPHTRGCGCTDGGQVTTPAKILARYLNHPNVAAALVIELGCEKTNLAVFGAVAAAERDQSFSKPVATLSVQKCGGTEGTIKRGLELLPDLLAAADKCRREPVPVSKLSLGLKCGGSDAFSGLSANPALGHASDLLIANGGTSLITEITEFEGAMHLYAQRCRTRPAARDVLAAMKRYAAYLRRAGAREMSDNPSPGNKAGGLINITIKSLGAMAKSGAGPVEGLLDYGDLPSRAGHWLLYGPSYDQESTPALVASGCQIVCFTTGRGTGIGNAIAPVVKIASNSELAQRMAGDIDVNAGEVLDGGATIETMGRRIFERVLAVASGEPCRAEMNKHREFMIWDEAGVSL